MCLRYANALIALHRGVWELNAVIYDFTTMVLVLLRTAASTDANAFTLFQNPNALPVFFVKFTVKRRNSKSNQTLVREVHSGRKSNPSMIPLLSSLQPLFIQRDIEQ